MAAAMCGELRSVAVWQCGRRVAGWQGDRVAGWQAGRVGVLGGAAARRDEGVEGVHLVLVAGEHDDQVLLVVLHHVEQDLDALLVGRCRRDTGEI